MEQNRIDYRDTESVRVLSDNCQGIVTFTKADVVQLLKGFDDQEPVHVAVDVTFMFPVDTAELSGMLISFAEQALPSQLRAAASEYISQCREHEDPDVMITGAEVHRINDFVIAVKNGLMG